LVLGPARRAGAAKLMPHASHLRQHTPPIIGVVIASGLIALIAAVWSVSTVSLLPPKLQGRELQTAGATTHVLIDLPRSKIANRHATWNYLDTLGTRATLLARLMTSPPALEHIGRRAGVPPDGIAAVAPVTANVEGVLTEPGSEQRARELQLSVDRYRLEAHSRSDRPIIDVYSQAPSMADAERLANAAIEGLRDYLRALAVEEGLDPSRQVRLHQLGRAQGDVVNAGMDLKIAGLTFLLVFGLSCLASLVLARLLSARSRAAADSPPRSRPSADASPGTSVTSSAAASAVASDGDWPRTTRVLPWTLAAFIAIVWLVPIDSIELLTSLPVDLKFDRLVMPFLLGTWILALVAGGRGGPRLRVTWIHVAVGAFVALAFLSVVLDAGPLNQALELDTSLKKLPLLTAYVSLFIVAASAVRPTEVWPFLRYTLVLAVIAAVGMLWEYRFEYNIFFDWSAKLLPVLPGVYEMAEIESGWDLSGRRMVHGPAAHGLVAVSMLAMALPVALVGLIQARRWRGRIVYGLAACVLLVAILATQRKTALVAPASAFLVLAYFRRRELLRMAPLAVILLLALVIASPGTIAPTINQFKPDQLEAETVSDRASDYDAIRPDVWTQPVFGRGYGSYQPLGHRILDSEILVRTVEMGVLGLAAFLLLPASVVATARSTIGSRQPIWGPPALAGAAAAVVFLVVAFLFDTMSFPQVPYIFLSLAGLVAALVGRRGRGPLAPR
jgi:hypothetical protein